MSGNPDPEEVRQSKRAKVSRTIVIDGHTILRSNNYDLEEGISANGRICSAGEQDMPPHFFQFHGHVFHIECCCVSTPADTVTRPDRDYERQAARISAWNRC